VQRSVRETETLCPIAPRMLRLRAADD